MEVHILNTSGSPFHRNYEAIPKEVDRLVTHELAEMCQEALDNRTAQEKWHDAPTRFAKKILTASNKYPRYLTERRDN